VDPTTVRLPLANPFSLYLHLHLNKHFTQNAAYLSAIQQILTLIEINFGSNFFKPASTNTQAELST